MRTLLIDDEAESLKATRLMLVKYCPDVEIVGEATGVSEGIAAINRYNPELVMLDVQMQDGTGFDLIEKIDNINFKLIFITSFDQFAIKAFRCSALDYILKPIEPEFLIQAIYKARNIVLRDFVKEQVNILLNARAQSNRIAIPSQEGLIMVNFSDILYCESDSNYTNFFLTNGNSHLVSRTLKEYEDQFPEKDFFRVHKSYLVNLHYVTKYFKGDGGQISLTNGALLPVSRMRKDMLLERLKNI